MLQKSHRLKNRKEIELTFNGGRSVRSRLVGCRFIYKKEGDSRFAFVVGTKIDKSAVVRNLVRRRLREIIRPFSKSLKQPVDMIIMAQVAAKKASFAELREDVGILLIKCGLLAPKV